MTRAAVHGRAALPLRERTASPSDPRGEWLPGPDGTRGSRGGKGFAEKARCVLADPPWQFSNRTGKMAPEHRRLRRYRTMRLEEICGLGVGDGVTELAHLYLWVPNALLVEGLRVMKAWGFTYKTNLVWYKVRRDGGPDGRGVGFYFRNVTELLLFGVRGRLRTLAAGRRAVNLLATRKREHSRKPDEVYSLIESCSPGPYLELFARHRRPGWIQWGDELWEPAGVRDSAPLVERASIPQV